MQHKQRKLNSCLLSYGDPLFLAPVLLERKTDLSSCHLFRLNFVLLPTSPIDINVINLRAGMPLHIRTADIAAFTKRWALTLRKH